MSRESGTLCSFNLENNTTFTRIKTFDPLAYAASLWDEFMPESSWRYIITLVLSVNTGQDVRRDSFHHGIQTDLWWKKSNGKNLIK